MKTEECLWIPASGNKNYRYLYPLVLVKRFPRINSGTRTLLGVWLWISAELTAMGFTSPIRHTCHPTKRRETRLAHQRESGRITLYWQQRHLSITCTNVDFVSVAFDKEVLLCLFSLSEQTGLNGF